MNLKLIKTEAENDAALARLGELMAAAPADGMPESDEMLALGALIRQFEEAHYKFDKPDPLEAIRFRMEQQGLRPTDMTPYFGTVSRFYEVMTGSRNLTLAMIRKLNRNLGIPAEVLIREPMAQATAEYPTDASPVYAVHDAESSVEPTKGVKPFKQLLEKLSPERRKRIKEKSAVLAKQMKRADEDGAGIAKSKQDRLCKV